MSASPMRLRNPAWTPEDIARLREFYPSRGPGKTAELLGRSYSSIRNKAGKLHLSSRDRWSPEQLEQLRQLYPTTSSRAIAKLLGRSLEAVYGCAAKLGLEKTPEYLRAHSRLQKGSSIGAEYRFPKGHAPANKGLRRPGWSPGRMSETQFKKGQRPRTWKPIGTVLADPEGYLRLKVKEHGAGERGWHKAVWPLVHHLIWMENHGPIPQGHAIVFKDGDRGNCAIENLECITRGDLAKRNAMWNRYPKELIAAILANGALKRRLRRIANGKEQAV